MVRTASAILFCAKAHPLNARDGTVPPQLVACIFPTLGWERACVLL